MVSSIVKSSSIKFEYENKDDNYWKFYTNRIERLHGEHHHHHEHHHEPKLFLEMKVPVAEVGIVTQKFEVSLEMFEELSSWMHHLHNKN